MIYPTIDSLLKKVDNKFALVIVVAKRARQLTNGAHKLTKCNSEKPVTIATNEVNENLVTFIRTKGDIK